MRGMWEESKHVDVVFGSCAGRWHGGSIGIRTEEDAVKYIVQREFASYDEVTVEAESAEEAWDKAEADWYDLNPEGVGDYVPTGRYFVYDENENIRRAW
jgi:hypothetical protein